MSESVQADSAPETEQVPDSTPSTPVADTMGGGFVEADSTLGTSDSVPEQSADPEDAAETAAAKTDTPAASDDDRDGRLRWDDYTRKTQVLADQQRAFEAEREAERQRMTEERQAVLQQVQAPPPPLSRSQQLQQAMADPDLTTEDRAGLGFIHGLAQQAEYQEDIIVNLTQRLAQIEPQVQQTGQTLGSIAQQADNERAQVIRAQVDEAIQMFGQETAQAAYQFIQNNLRDDIVNPQTDAPFTVAELVGRHSGHTAGEAQNGRAKTRQQRQAAKQQTAPAGATHPAQAEPEGPISKTEALRLIKERM